MATLKSGLFDAVACGNVSAVRELLTAGELAHLFNADGVTPLQIACDSGQVDITRLLLHAKAQIPLSGHDRGLLIERSALGNTEIVQTLLDAGGVDPNQLTADAPYSYRPSDAELQQLVTACKPEPGELALAADAFLLRFPHSVACTCTVLLAASCTTALCAAAAAGHIDCMRVLLAAKAQIFLRDAAKSELESRKSAATELTSETAAEAARRHLPKCANALHFAACGGQVESCRSLLVSFCCPQALDSLSSCRIKMQILLNGLTSTGVIFFLLDFRFAVR